MSASASSMGDGPPDPRPTSPGERFSREQLDAAEPVRPPSPRRRWLLGLAIGMLAFGLLSVEGVPVLTLVCLPFATTPAGAGVLVGSGAAWLVSFGWSIVLWLSGDLAGSPLLAAWMIAGIVSIVAGLLGTALVVRRERARLRRPPG